MDQVSILEIRAGWRLLNLESGEKIAVSFQPNSDHT